MSNSRVTISGTHEGVPQIVIDHFNGATPRNARAIIRHSLEELEQPIEDNLRNGFLHILHHCHRDLVPLKEDDLTSPNEDVVELLQLAYKLEGVAGIYKVAFRSRECPTIEAWKQASKDSTLDLVIFIATSGEEPTTWAR